MNPIRIIMADDHTTWLTTACEWLAASGDFLIEGCATNGSDAVELCRRLRPDVALLDISMPGMNGLEAARQIHAEGLALHIVLMSIHQRPEYAAAARSVGARALVAKHLLRSELRPTIKRLVTGVSPHS
jgi:DNA-binding NarL/FixJ family response regulator